MRSSTVTRAGLFRECAWATGLLVALYGALRQRTWSLDGALHTLASVYPTDGDASGHVLLRPVAFLWTRLLGLAQPLDFAQRYDALEVLFGLFGIAALVILFSVVRRRVAALPAWLALIAVAMMRCTERQITTLDEKPLGLLLLAIAILMTDRALRPAGAAGERPEPVLRELLPVGLAWVFAVAGHLQNTPFAAAGLLALATRFHGPGRWRRAGALALRLLPLLAAAGLVLLVLIHVGTGGWSALPKLAEHLFHHRPAPPAPPTLVALAKSTLMGWVKAFFLIDRFSPTEAVFAAPAGFLVLVSAVLLGLRRRADALATALVAGSAGLMLLIPAANFFPDYGDSYTMVVLALFVPLAAAPTALLAGVTVLILAINAPAAVGYSWPETTVQQQIARMTVEQERRGLPWVVLEELRPFDLQQGLAPVYYRMSDSLRVVDASLATLPAGGFLLELPQPVGPDGYPREAAAEWVMRLAAHGRRARVERLTPELLTVRSDFRRYGEYLVVEPAATP